MNGQQKQVFAALEQTGIIPVVVLDDAANAAPLGEALLAGGLAAAEVTFRTDAAEESIRTLSRMFPELLVGAGTVLTAEQAERAMEAGARFIVSPGMDEDFVWYCLDKGYPVCPGTQTASEMLAALSMGLDRVKFFPAENAGGLPMLHAIGAALTKLKFMPTGGINASNVKSYLASDKVFCCGGSWMVNKELIKAGDFETIRIKTAEAAAIVKEIRG